MIKFDEGIIYKWKPIINNRSGDKDIFLQHRLGNNYFINLCCHYCEFLSLKDELNEDVLQILYGKIENPVFRKKIKSEYINLITGNKEFLLEDSSYYIPGSINANLNIDQIVFLFGIEFLTDIDKYSAREYKIKIMLG